MHKCVCTSTNPVFALTLLYTGQAFRKNISFTSKVSMQLDENWQRMPKNRGNLLFLGDKSLVIPIINGKDMPCLPNATLSNNGNVLYELENALLHDFRSKLSFCAKQCENFKRTKKCSQFSGFFGAPSFSNKPKLGLKFQLKV